MSTGTSKKTLRVTMLALIAAALLAASALLTWRSTRSERVSRPCRSMNADIGEMHAPVSRRRTALIHDVRTVPPNFL